MSKTGQVKVVEEVGADNLVDRELDGIEAPLVTREFRSSVISVFQVAYVATTEDYNLCKHRHFGIQLDFASSHLSKTCSVYTMSPGLTTTPSTPTRPFPLTRNLTASSRTKHPSFYLPDGTLLLSLHPHIFKIHKSLLTRHSQVLDKWIIEATDPKAMDLVQFVDGRGVSVLDLPGDVRGRVGGGDFERLMGVLYHDL